MLSLHPRASVQQFHGWKAVLMLSAQLCLQTQQPFSRIQVAADSMRAPLMRRHQAQAEEQRLIRQIQEVQAA